MTLRALPFRLGSKVDMRLYLRIVRAVARATYEAAEMDGLRAALVATPGVQRVLELDRHYRGGYALTVEHAGATDRVVQQLASAGYRIVI